MPMQITNYAAGPFQNYNPHNNSQLLLQQHLKMLDEVGRAKQMKQEALLSDFNKVSQAQREAALQNANDAENVYAQNFNVDENGNRYIRANYWDKTHIDKGHTARQQFNKDAQELNASDLAQIRNLSDYYRQQDTTPNPNDQIVLPSGRYKVGDVMEKYKRFNDMPREEFDATVPMLHEQQNNLQSDAARREVLRKANYELSRLTPLGSAPQVPIDPATGYPVNLNATGPYSPQLQAAVSLYQQQLANYNPAKQEWDLRQAQMHAAQNALEQSQQQSSQTARRATPFYFQQPYTGGGYSNTKEE